MNEIVKPVLSDVAYYSGQKPAIVRLLMNPADSLAAQIENARAVYGSVDMRAGEVEPAPVTKMTSLKSVV